MNFRFGVSNLGVVLGKSPSTIRSWERKGAISYTRVGSNRSLDVAEVCAVARRAFERGWITRERFVLINEAMSELRMLEGDE